MTDGQATRKLFMGVRVRRLREERGLTQVALARLLSISPSYLNQIENNQRPMTVPVLLRISTTLGVDVQAFSEDEEARRVAALRDVLTEAEDDVPLTEIRELALNLPGVASAVAALHRRYRREADRAEVLALQLGDERAIPTSREPYEEIRDFFYAHHNHIPDLDREAERIFEESHLPIGDMREGLMQRLAERHGVRCRIAGAERLAGPLRRYDSERRELEISSALTRGQQAFQLAIQLALLEVGDQLSELVQDATLTSAASRQLARIGLAQYFAGALILPYLPFLQCAERMQYDIERIGLQFGVGFETVCHRLSTLQRPEARGVPFFFVRVDRAGNISKRQSATSFHFSKIGGTCPLWNVYEAFSAPDRTLTQLAQMPDGRTYLWVARCVSHRSGGYGAPAKTFAVGLGCDVRHAQRLVYSAGLDLNNPEAATPIGAGCRVCERPACPQRAFPRLGRPLTIEEFQTHFEPYRFD